MDGITATDGRRGDEVDGALEDALIERMEDHHVQEISHLGDRGLTIHHAHAMEQNFLNPLDTHVKRGASGGLIREE